MERGNQMWEPMWDSCLMYLFLSVKLYANLFLHLKSLSCGQFSLTHSNATENSVHVTSHDYVESESSYSWHYFRFQSTYRNFFHLTFLLRQIFTFSYAKYNDDMRECPSQLSNQKRYDFFLRASIKPVTWNIPEHAGTFRNIPEHEKIKMIFIKKK